MSKSFAEWRHFVRKLSGKPSSNSEGARISSDWVEEGVCWVAFWVGGGGAGLENQKTVRKKLKNIKSQGVTYSCDTRWQTDVEQRCHHQL